MADITLAEFNGSVWLVGGEDYVDDLLANTLPAKLMLPLILFIFPCLMGVLILPAAIHITQAMHH